MVSAGDMGGMKTDLASFFRQAASHSPLAEEAPQFAPVGIVVRQADQLSAAEGIRLVAQNINGRTHRQVAAHRGVERQ